MRGRRKSLNPVTNQIVTEKVGSAWTELPPPSLLTRRMAEQTSQCSSMSPERHPPELRAAPHTPRRIRLANRPRPQEKEKSKREKRMYPALAGGISPVGLHSAASSRPWSLYGGVLGCLGGGRIERDPVPYIGEARMGVQVEIL
jgi:hypothetical protein